MDSEFIDDDALIGLDVEREQCFFVDWDVVIEQSACINGDLPD